MDETIGVGVGPAERAHHAGGGGPTPEPRRMSARRKQETVLRLLRMPPVRTAAVLVDADEPV